tara:strand:+ start:1555 stop:2637 length:1083 start_codon:yes stop_codon:yes gene_type:complete
MNKNILIICTSLNLGGSEKQAVWLANRLVKSNYTVFFVSLKDSGVLSKELDPKVLVNNFKLGRARNNFSKIYYVLLGLIKLIKIVNRNKIDTIVTVLFHSNLTGKIIRIFSKHKISHVVTFRSDRLTKRDSKISMIRTFIFKKFIVDSKTVVVFNSQSGYKNMELKGGSQHVILNAPLNSISSGEKAKNKFIYIGRLDELKNVKSLVLAFKSLNKKETIELDIFGKGPELPELKRIVNDNKLENVIHFQEVDRSIPNKINQYQALLLVSTHEAFPNVVIEAMNSEVIPISTKVGDVEWIIGEDRGIIIEGFDEESILEGIRTFLKLSSEEKKKIQKKAKSFINNELNEEKIYKQWLSVIN